MGAHPERGVAIYIMQENGISSFTNLDCKGQTSHRWNSNWPEIWVIMTPPYPHSPNPTFSVTWVKKDMG